MFRLFSISNPCPNQNKSNVASYEIQRGGLRMSNEPEGLPQWVVKDVHARKHQSPNQISNTNINQI